MKSKTKKVTKSELQKKLWKLLSEKIRKERPMCELCKIKPATQVHHIFSRRFKSTMFDEDNLISICNGCHLKTHTDPEWARRKIIEKIGEEKYDELYQKAHNTTLDWGLQEYLEAIAKLSEASSKS